MKFEFQSLESIRPTLDRFLGTHPTSKLETVYRKFRSRADITLLGDWPLISEIVYRSARIDRFYTPKQVVEAYKATSDPYLLSRRTDSELVLFLTNKDELKQAVADDK